MTNFFVKTAISSSPYAVYDSIENFVLPRNLFIFTNFNK
jgi:hypothetical protein